MKKRILYLIVCVFAFTTVSAQITSVAIVGAGVGGWPGSEGNPGPMDVHQMIKVDADNWYLESVVVTGNGIKFRANNNWDDGSAGGGNWGAPASGPQWPSAVAVNAGSSNDIKVGVVPGIYKVTFNTTTRVYLFEGGPPIPTVNISGSAVAVGELSMQTNDAINFTIQAIFLEGTAKFDVNGTVLSNSAFPIGTAFEGGSPIPVPAGEWLIKFNVETGEYSFTSDPLYPIIKVTGSALGGSNFEKEMTTTDGVYYTINNLATVLGEAKFRKNNSLTTSYGDEFFPSGTATLSGKAIPVPMGTWNVTFNLMTGAYTFTGTSYTSFPTIAIVGSAVGGWPGDPGNPGPIDINQMTTTDGIHYIIYELSVIKNGSIKFRANNKWDDGSAGGGNWGAPAVGPQWPSGVAVNAGSSSDIKVGVLPGIYTVTFNRITEEYFFEGGPPIPKVNIIGSAVVGGELAMQTNDGINFTIQALFQAGTTHFDVDGILLSDSNFPSGTAFEGGSPIPVSAGTYNVTFDLSTGFYVFKFPVVSMTGSAVGGWGINTDLTTTDGNNYYSNSLTIADGEVRFLQDYNSEISWGDPTSASGNIVVSAGTYDITFTPSGTYVFGRSIEKGIWTFRDSSTKALVFTNNPALLSTKGFSSVNFRVYPNPTQNVWNFTSTNERIESIKIIDVLGKNVITVTAKSNTVNVDASSLKKGIYFAKITTAKANETLKLMKN